MPTGYVLIFYWTIVALGGALFLGTGAALLRYRRTGMLPGEPATTGKHRPSQRESRRVALRCALGFGLTAVGATGLVATY
jgi:hypothetical protein